MVGDDTGPGERRARFVASGHLTVLQLPPNESRSTDVIIELRYGTYFCFSCNAMMTCSR